MGTEISIRIVVKIMALSNVILALAVVGLIIGAAVWVVLFRSAPRYTATTAINVLPPGDIDPMSFGSIQPNKNLYRQLRFTKAEFMKQQSFLQELIRKEQAKAHYSG